MKKERPVTPAADQTLDLDLQRAKKSEPLPRGLEPKAQHGRRTLQNMVFGLNNLEMSVLGVNNLEMSVLGDLGKGPEGFQREDPA